MPLRSISPSSTGYQFFQPSSLISAFPFRKTLQHAGSVRNRIATGSNSPPVLTRYIDTCAVRGEICMQRAWGKGLIRGLIIHGTGLLRKEIARISKEREREKE